MSNDVKRLYGKDGNMSIIKGEEKNQGYWKIGIVNHLHNDKDNIIRVAQFRIGKKLIDRPIQLLSPLELHCEGITTTNKDEKKNQLNPSATEFRPNKLLLKSQSGS